MSRCLIEERLYLLEQLGVDQMCVLDQTETQVRTMMVIADIKEYLIAALALHGVPGQIDHDLLQPDFIANQKLGQQRLARIRINLKEDV